MSEIGKYTFVVEDYSPQDAEPEFKVIEVAIGGPQGPGLRWTGAWEHGVTYKSQDIVFHGGFAYVSLQNQNLGNEPVPDGTVYWEPIIDASFVEALRDEAQIAADSAASSAEAASLSADSAALSADAAALSASSAAMSADSAADSAAEAANLIAATPLGALGDVDLETVPPVDKDALVYDAASGHWVAEDIQDLLDTASLDNLGNVDLETAPPVDKDTLVYDATSGQWIAGDIRGLLDTASLGDLGNVDLDTNQPSHWQALVFDAGLGEWVPATLQTKINSIGDIEDVNTTGGVEDGYVLVWNSETQKWEPAQPPSKALIQVGTLEVPGGASAVMEFLYKFPETPSVTIGPEGTGKAYIKPGSVSRAGFTLVNPETFAVNINWIAIYSIDGGAMNTLITYGGGGYEDDESLPIDTGGQILRSPAMPG